MECIDFPVLVKRGVNMTKEKIAVLIPCFNEETTVKDVIMEFKEVLPNAVIYVYDNNSSDETSRVAKEAGAVVRHEYRQGKGFVLKRMFAEIEADVYLLVDGDFYFFDGDGYNCKVISSLAEESVYIYLNL